VKEHERNKLESAIDALEWIAAHEDATYMDNQSSTDCEEADAFREVVSRARRFLEYWRIGGRNGPSH
jgi:hypothetical protein